MDILNISDNICYYSEWIIICSCIISFTERTEKGKKRTNKSVWYQPPLLQQKEKPPATSAGPEQYILPKVSNNSVQLGGSPMFNGGSNIGF